QSEWAGPFSFTTLLCPVGDIVLDSQAAVNDFAVNNPYCTQITGSLHIQGNDITDLSPLSNITNVGGYLAIMYNPQLVQIGGLSSLTTLGGFIAITDNPQLINLNGLSSLTSIAADINIQNNNVLNNIAGLQNINPATIQSVFGYGLYLVNNPQLSVCDLGNFCTYLSNPLNVRTISGNAGDCVSEVAVMAACNSCETPFNFDTPVTSVSASLNWTGTGTYVIEWGEVGFAHGTGNIVSGISANNYQLSSLDSDTEYEFYIR